MVIRPYGYAIWERMQAEVDARIKAAGAANAYFPLFIPVSYFESRGRTRRGLRARARGRDPRRRQGARRARRRPPHERDDLQRRTSRNGCRATATCRCCINQWANVVRWELRPRLFLRTTEFLWQEGHTCHATEDDASALRRDRSCCDVYADFMVERARHPGARRDARRRGSASPAPSTR